MTTYMSKDRFWKNENRIEIVRLITINEGITFTNLMEELNIKNGTLAYHTSVLERRRYIKSVRDGKYKRFYPRGAKFIHSTTLEDEIISVLQKNPDMSQKEIADLVEETQQTISYNIRNLAKKNMVYRKRDGKYMRCNLTDLCRAQNGFAEI